MDEVMPKERACRDFRSKFPDDVLQENLAGQLWFGAEVCAFIYIPTSNILDNIYQVHLVPETFSVGLILVGYTDETVISHFSKKKKSPTEILSSETHRPVVIWVI